MSRDDFPRGRPVQKTTTHGLVFESSTHFRTYGLDDGYNWRGFRVGTVEGLWSDKGGLHILALKNTEPHNGHLDDVWDWFMGNARKHRCTLTVHEVMNPGMGRILLRLGFVPIFGTKDFKWTP